MKEYSVWIDEAEKIVSFHEVDNSELISLLLHSKTSLSPISMQPVRP